MLRGFLKLLQPFITYTNGILKLAAATCIFPFYFYIGDKQQWLKSRV